MENSSNFADLPASTVFEGEEAMFADLGTSPKASRMVSSGGEWKPVQGIMQVALSQEGAATEGIVTDEVLAEAALPAGLAEDATLDIHCAASFSAGDATAATFALVVAGESIATVEAAASGFVAIAAKIVAGTAHLCVTHTIDDSGALVSAIAEATLDFSVDSTVQLTATTLHADDSVTPRHLQILLMK